MCILLKLRFFTFIFINSRLLAFIDCKHLIIALPSAISDKTLISNINLNFIIDKINRLMVFTTYIIDSLLATPQSRDWRLGIEGFCLAQRRRILIGYMVPAIPRFYSTSRKSNLNSNIYFISINGMPLPVTSKRAQVKYYSSIVTTNNLNLTSDFIEWFRGFVDAEGLFSIGNKSNNSFNFKFSIEVHKDDIEALKYIQSVLGFGTVKLTRANAVIYNVISKDDLRVIIDLFSKFPLNTTKHLNFLDFVKAFNLYFSTNHQESRIINKPLIDNIKNNMNSKRSDFILPKDHKVIINDNWLLGFVEGDGSFFFNLTNKTLVFSIKQKGNYELILAIKEYLDLLAKNKDILSKVKIYTNKDGFELVLSDLKFIDQIILPLLNPLSWHSKKFLDYKDWKFILKMLQKGFHYLPEGLALIKRIASQMNNNRLGRPKIITENECNLLHTEIDKFLLENPSNYEYIEGRTYIKSLNRFRIERLDVELVELSFNKVIASFSSITECAKFLGLGRPVTTERVRSNHRFLFKENLVFLRYSPASNGKPRS